MTHRFFKNIYALLGILLLLSIAGTNTQAQQTKIKRSLTVKSEDIVLAASADIDQCRNGTELLPLGCTSADRWVNGNANHTNAHWSETEFIAYRMKFGGLTLEQHEVIIGYDILKGTQHAIDYLGMYSATETTAAPCAGLTMCVDDPMTFPIPEDTVTVTNQTNPITGLPVEQLPGVFTMWGGTITDVQYLPYAGGEERQIMVTFTASIADPLLAWGGHIAWIGDWGAGNSAVTINGSPYHMRIISLDGTGGNQDLPLDSSAVIPSGVVTVVKEVYTMAPDTSNASILTFNFTATANFGSTLFGLIDDNEGPGTDFKLSSPITSFGAGNTIVITEQQSDTRFSLSNVNCAETGTQDSTKNSLLSTATIIVQQGEAVTCTFQNSQLVPTADPADLSGRVMDQFMGVRGAYVTATNMVTGQARTVLTNTFGYYHFTGLELGQAYLVRVSAKGYTFEPESRIVTLLTDVVGVDFVASAP